MCVRSFIHAAIVSMSALALLAEPARPDTIDFNDVYLLDQSDPPLPVSRCSYLYSEPTICGAESYVASTKTWQLDNIAAGPTGDEVLTLFSNPPDVPPFPLLPASIGMPGAQYQCVYDNGSMWNSGVWGRWDQATPLVDTQNEALVITYLPFVAWQIRSDVLPTPPILETNTSFFVETPHPVYGMAFLGEFGDLSHFLAAMPTEVHHYGVNRLTAEFQLIAVHPIGGALGGDFTSMEFLQTGAPGVGYLYATNARGVGRAEVDLSAYLPYLDCNQNMIEDSLEIQWEFDTDCNGNGIPTSCEPPCPADVAAIGGPCDGVVDTVDFFALLQNWGPCADPGACPLDFTGPPGVPDGTVGVDDFFAMLQNWGPCPQ